MNTQFFDPKDPDAADHNGHEVIDRSGSDGVFHIGSDVTDHKPCETMFCKRCGGNDFHVGFGITDRYMAIKCITCEWELSVS